jgi:hypothetical protein
VSKRSHFIKVRVNDVEYHALRKRADAQGMTMSEHVRTTVTSVHRAQDVAAELAALKELVRQAALAAPAKNVAQDLALRETVLLLRELAAVRDAQILARVRTQLGVQLDGSRGGAA